MISTNSVRLYFVNLTRAEIVSAFSGSQVSFGSPPFTAPCQLPVSQASLWIGIYGAFAVEGSGCCVVAHPTSTTAAIMISCCFIWPKILAFMIELAILLNCGESSVCLWKTILFCSLAHFLKFDWTQFTVLNRKQSNFILPRSFQLGTATIFSLITTSSLMRHYIRVLSSCILLLTWFLNKF